MGLCQLLACSKAFCDYEGLDGGFENRYSLKFWPLDLFKSYDQIFA